MRLGIGLSLSSIGLSSPGSILSIMGTSVVALWDAASLTASPVSSWPDSSGNGFALTQGTGANQPTWNATAGPNANPAVLFDGIDDFLSNAALNLPAPAAVPSTFWAVMRQVTWTADRRPWDCGGGGNLFIVQQGTTPRIDQGNGTLANANTGLTVNVYKRIAVCFTNSASDEIQVGGTTVTGASAGNNDPNTGFVLGAANIVAALPANVQVCILAIFRVLPSIAQRAALDAYVTQRFGAGLV